MDEAREALEKMPQLEPPLTVKRILHASRMRNWS
jgi:hypothetical protein